MHFGFVNMPIEYYSPVSGGAIATIIAQTARELLRAGHDVTVYTPVDANPTYDIGRVVPLRFPTREQMSWGRRKLSGLRRRLNRYDWPGFDAYLAPLRSAVRADAGGLDAVITFNDLVTPKYLRPLLPSGGRVYTWLQNEWRTQQTSLTATLAATDRFLTCSQYIAEWTAREHKIPADRFEVVHSGVNLDQFGPPDEAAGPTPRAGKRELRVLFVGRLDPNKGPDIAADAVAALQREGHAVSFTVAGAKWFYGSEEDPYTVKLKEKLKTIGAEYLGHVTRDRIASVYQQADVVCVLSRSNEPFGLVVLEAMACGCAVLSSDRGGLPEACGDAGVLVNPDDLDGVTAVLRRFATDRRWLTSRQLASFERASGASWATVAARLVAIASYPERRSAIRVGSSAERLGATG